ncbi:MAG: zinc transport system substrate-binding protein [Lentimonas sp.]|jgi:zinc transport system substrate-binding protein
MAHFKKSILVLVVCGAWGALTAAEVWVSILPQKYFVEAIGGEFVSVEVLVRPGQSPELYAPSAAQLARVAKADAYISIGVPVEYRILPRIAANMPDVRILQTAELPEAAYHEHHNHDDSGACVHGDVDPHVWMNPLWVAGTALQVQQLLGELVPEHAAEFAANAADFVARLRQLDEALLAQLQPYAGRAFYINHPSLGHFAARYGLTQLSIEHAGSAPSARRVADLVKQAKAEKVSVIFTQPEFGRSGATVLAQALGVDVIEINPLSESYFQNMRAIADHLERSFQP